MRVLGAIAIVAGLVFGVVGFLAVSGFHSDLDEARTNAEQLVRIQSIRTNLVKADANATNAFLVGGLEPPEARDGVHQEHRHRGRGAGGCVRGPSRRLPHARAGEPGPHAVHGSDRGGPRQQPPGLPGGRGLPPPSVARAAGRSVAVARDPGRVEQQRVEAVDLGGNTASDTLVILLVLALAALVAMQVYLSVKTRRTFNRPLVAATAVVLVAGLVAIGAVAWSQSQANDARDGPYRQTVALANGRIGGFDAKSAEALALIARGSGAAFEERFRTASASAAGALSDAAVSDPASTRSTRDAFNQYLSEHAKLLALDQDGQHDDAVAAATGTGPANTAFAAFDRVSARALATEAADLGDALDDAAALLLPVAWLVLLAGLAAAVLAWRGVSERLREYR